MLLLPVMAQWFGLPDDPRS
jgi:hypothetical protein